jgi:hypothetical protein
VAEQPSIMVALACALGGLLVRSCVELVWLAVPAYPADRRPTLLKRDETTIGGTIPGSVTVNGAPLVGVGRSAVCTKRDAKRGNGNIGENKSSKHGALQNTRYFAF